MPFYAPGISKGRKTDDYKTNSSMKFGYFEVAFHARSPLPPPDESKTGQPLYVVVMKTSIRFRMLATFSDR